MFIDAMSRRQIDPPCTFEGNVWDLRFSPDGRTLAVAGHDATRAESGGVIDLVDVRSHLRWGRVQLPRFPHPHGCSA